ncbi:MAG: DedA family protein [Candidatus Riflebacteria bacterium]|nr:DedA family protein [Candidatus Riflebacteria bacterium]
MKYVKKLYEWVLSWAHSPYALTALFVLAFAESSFFPIPPDVLLIALALAKPQLSIYYATICTAGSVSGAMFGYIIGYAFWQAVGEYFFAYIPGFTRELFAQVCTSYEQNSSLIVFTAAFTPIPYKVFTITAGVSKITLAPFLLASIFGRGARFFLVGILFKKFGPTVKSYIDKYFNLLTILVVVIYIVAFYFVPMLASNGK